LTFLLTLGARVLTLLEFVVRRSLAATNTTLSGLFSDRPENMPWTSKSPRRAERDSGSAISVACIMADRPAGIRTDKMGANTRLQAG
jgi:hypothetical protein